MEYVFETPFGTLVKDAVHVDPSYHTHTIRKEKYYQLVGDTTVIQHDATKHSIALIGFICIGIVFGAGLFMEQ